FSHDLVSSELFGHERGSFTGASRDRRGLLEEADRGTLFLDEIDALPKESQVMMLHVLQEGTFRRVGSNRERHSTFQLISATNGSIEELVRRDTLRADFVHRINHVTIHIPPLRHRRNDIPTLAVEFLRSLENAENLKVRGFTPEALARLVNYRWPGNVRQLQARVHAAAFRAQYDRRPLIDVSDLELEHSLTRAPGSFRAQVQDFEYRLVQDALRMHGNNQSHAARALQLDRSTFRRILSRTEVGT
ncbi:MAG: sigma-54-dependent Fis family transcriptional regulator, partial [Bdellovibrionales bacterium]|nr:sigma-54-dependent Fis family transcriptional regulator [Bdellovibrionales bacterium]